MSICTYYKTVSHEDMIEDNDKEVITNLVTTHPKKAENLDPIFFSNKPPINVVSPWPMDDIANTHAVLLYCRSDGYE